MTASAHSSSRRFDRNRFFDLARRAGGILFILLLVFAGLFGWQWFFQGEHESMATVESAAPTTVQLSADKLAALNLTLAPARVERFQISKTVPGSIQFDATRHLQLRTPAACTVTEVLVPTGQLVTAGQPLATLTSTEIGLARNEVDRAAADLELATMKFQWTEQTHHNLGQLLTFLKDNPSVEQVEKTFREKLLGEHWNQLVAAYSQSLVAQTVVAQTQSLQTEGAIAGRMSRQRISDRDIASAAFKSCCEETQFESERELMEATAAVATARRAWELAQERVSLLLGPYGQPSSDPQAGRSDFVVTAPWAGRIEQINAVTSGRLQANDALMELADTRRQWVTAHIHQKDWDALKTAVDQALTVTAPALPDRQFAARVIHVGAEVSATTLAVPMVAEIDNAEGLFRSGMFVWVRIPMAAPREALVVPTSAIQRHENQAFVFVSEGDKSYRRVDVETGEENAEWTEVVRGLKPDDLVVSEDAFFLKSELLLEHEAE
jgi:cobalt-zinc-cadmium efflux system membrane fusion protein